ncbi:mannose-1-phosphate guanylyltransferase/mannose-6-phosphate isomerase [Salinisphaera orenii]|uniref:mannose-1-phosphate guanylyltransferase/mannose-6-phosphate isomerase n=1 Tax=Salinisphaera orenii TaxID=856731 RepID=UPI000DBEA07B
MTKVIPVILTGGNGTRLWPLSRQAQPKPFLSLNGGLTLLQATLTRIAADERTASPLVVCNSEHRFLVAEQCNEVQRDPELVLLEPNGRDTAPALTTAAMAASESNDEDAVLLVMPADHVFRDQAAFRQGVETAVAAAEDGRLLTFGVRPDRVETGYGYLHAGVCGADGTCEVRRFVEKPDAQTAQSYLEFGEHYWNSGIFAMRTSRWLEEAERHTPAIFEACRSAYHEGHRNGNFHQLNATAFGECPAESIDYAVMERAERVAMVPLDAGWSDVGSWRSLNEVFECDADGNVVRGDVLMHNTRDSIVSAHSRLVTTVGLSDVIVAETQDAVLVVHKDQVQDVKKVVQNLDNDERDEGRQHRRVPRPWGAYEPLDLGECYQVKRLTVSPGAELSLQMHYHRSEHWVVVSGTARVTIGDDTFELEPNQSTHIPIGTVHRLANPHTEPLEVIEVQSGDYLGEDDIVRFDDVYGRIESA